MQLMTGNIHTYFTLIMHTCSYNAYIAGYLKCYYLISVHVGITNVYNYNLLQKLIFYLQKGVIS